MSFAIIETGGKQYKVSASKILEIEKLDAEKGKIIKVISIQSKKNPKRKVINKTTITTPLGPNGKPFNAPSISSSPPKPLKTKANIVAPTKSAKM